MIGDRIKTLRKHLKLTQLEFANKIGMTNNAVYEWEASKVEIKESSILLLEKIFDINPQWLRKGLGEMFTPSITPEISDIVDWVKSLSKEEQIWIKIEMQRKFPEFKTWMDEKKIPNSDSI